MLRSASNRWQGYITSAASVTMAVLTLIITIGAATWGIAARRDTALQVADRAQAIIRAREAGFGRG